MSIDSFQAGVQHHWTSGTIKIIDLLFIKKDADGNVEVVELSAMEPAEGKSFYDGDGEIDDLFNKNDSMLAAAMVKPRPPLRLPGVHPEAGATLLADSSVAAEGVAC